jgi:hypothetical protein
LRADINDLAIAILNLELIFLSDFRAITVDEGLGQAKCNWLLVFRCVNLLIVAMALSIGLFDLRIELLHQSVLLLLDRLNLV